MPCAHCATFAGISRASFLARSGIATSFEPVIDTANCPIEVPSWLAISDPMNARMIGATAASSGPLTSPVSLVSASGVCFKTFVSAVAIPSASGSISAAQFTTVESNQSRRLQAGILDLESAGKFVASSNQVFAISSATWASAIS